jgi:hypothetical protein
MDCKYNSAMVKDVVCRYKAARNNFGHFVHAFTPIVAYKTLWLEMHSLVRNSANVWQAGLINIKQDMCRYYEDKNNILLLVMGAFKEVLIDKVVKQCPYPVSS